MFKVSILIFINLVSFVSFAEQPNKKVKKGLELYKDKKVWFI